MTGAVHPIGRWFVDKNGVFFISVEDLITDYKALQKDNLNPPMEVIVAGLETSRDIAMMEYEKLKVKNPQNESEDTKPQG